MSGDITSGDVTSNATQAGVAAVNDLEADRSAARAAVKGGNILRWGTRQGRSWSGRGGSSVLSGSQQCGSRQCGLQNGSLVGSAWELSQCIGAGGDRASDTRRTGRVRSRNAQLFSRQPCSQQPRRQQLCNPQSERVVRSDERLSLDRSDPR